jgi:hypothetical protein
MEQMTEVISVGSDITKKKNRKDKSSCRLGKRKGHWKIIW